MSKLTLNYYQEYVLTPVFRESEYTPSLCLSNLHRVELQHDKATNCTSKIIAIF